MRGTRRLLLLGGLLLGCGSAVAAGPERVYVRAGYHWAPGYYTGGVYHPAPGYYYFAPGYYTAAPRPGQGEPTVVGYGTTPRYTPPPVVLFPGAGPLPSPSRAAVPGHTPGSFATQRVHGVNPNYYHGYLHPRANDLGGP